MKKITLIMQPKDADAAVRILRSLGVLHVEHKNLPRGKEISELHDDVSIVKSALEVLAPAATDERQVSKTSRHLTDWKHTAKHIIDLRKRYEQLDGYSRTLINRIAQWEMWGDFDPDRIRELTAKGIYVRLYQIPVKEIKKLPRGVVVEKITVTGNIANCAVISTEPVEIPFKEVALPKIGLEKMRGHLTENNRVMALLKKKIGLLAGMRIELTRIKRKLEYELEFHEALMGMGKVEELTYLTGYIPYDAIGPVTASAKKERWGIVVEDPSREDIVPTLIRNPRWISLISPIFRVLEIVPGYKEIDISLSFLIFFSIFFGILIGDIGYGFIYMLLAAIAHKKLAGKVRDKAVFFLFYMLSSCAIIWGLLTGTFFGQEWIAGTFKPLMPAFASNKNIQIICFFLGALHLSIAHLWRASVKAPSLAALADIGWTIVLWGGFFLAKTLILGDAFPVFGKWFFITGAILVVLFTNPGKNVIKAIGAGFGSLLLSFVNTFTDIVSYIRLFAVGLATVAVADAFNKMAMDIGFNSILRGAATSIILILGHLLNVVLGPMAVLVHGVRLNVLEFCSHIDVKWSGFQYNPLREETLNKF